MFNKREYIKQWRKDNPEYMKQWYKENKEISLEKAKIYYLENKEKRMAYRVKNEIKIKNYTKKYMKKYRIENHDKIIENNERYKETKNRNRKERYRIDLKYNLNRKIREAIRKSLKGNKKGGHWEILVGYSYDDLVKRLKKTMPEDYTWQDYLDGKLHIDHKIPISAHNFDSSKHVDFQRCWSLNNLRLLPAKENMIKHARLEKPFQPALFIKIKGCRYSFRKYIGR